MAPLCVDFKPDKYTTFQGSDFRIALCIERQTKKNENNSNQPKSTLGKDVLGVRVPVDVELGLVSVPAGKDEDSVSVLGRLNRTDHRFLAEAEDDFG